MDIEKIDKLLAEVGKEKRVEVLEKLKGAKDPAERMQIVNSHIGDENVPEWLQDSYELTDEQLENIAGGTDMPWDYDVDDTCCS